MTIKSKKRADVKPAPRGLYRLGQAVRITYPRTTLHGRVGVVVRAVSTPRGLEYELALWPSVRLVFAAEHIESLPASEHCTLPGLTRTCQPRPSGRCVWCDRDLADWDAATWKAGDLERMVIRGQ